MKYESKQTIRHTFDADELKRRVENELTFYRSRDTTARQRGALVKVSHSNATWFLQEIAEKVLAGYTLAEASPILTTYPEFSAFYVKPAALQQDDIAAITAELEAEYKAELKAAYDSHIEAIVAETVAREEAAQRKKEDQARAKLIEAARRDAVACLGTFDAS
ncbi:hypothetical protein HNE05_07640 [Aquipseudomonas campi]|uniref:Uncharacterized protein n=1 Tax=Aquipseudomonas campi TaxID=2731681 RepID=A0A6M8G201_9GAMM|nr:hypothetical protein [Pseudomonas campi]QKE63235.1 hypothetical protein HNE05_07640 [Pseudomonas campi]